MRGLTEDYPDSFTTPRGYLVFGEVERLDNFRNYYKVRKLATFDPQTWLHRGEGIRHAKFLFGDFSQWLYGQLDGEFLYGRRLDFLEDTLRFITMGRRNVSVQNWNDLLEDFPETAVHINRNTAEAQLKRAFPVALTTVDVIVNWCSQPGGFDDMVCTLDILFGEAKE